MADRSTHLSMPFILPSQAQKHVTHNEALVALDALVHLVLAGQASAPPASPADGLRFVVSAPAAGAWSGREGKLAAWQDGAWQFFEPKQGWLAWFSDEQKVKVFRSTGWTNLIASDATLASLGVNATADTTNRLAVASEASLFNNVGHGHQVKINKAAADDTASLLFQSNWTGFAEMGLAGDNGFSIKVSDGATWRTGMKIHPNGAVAMPNRPAARAHKAIGPVTPAANSRSGFTTLNPAQGAVSLGTVLADGSKRLIVPAAGLYLVSLMVTAVTSSGHSTALIRNADDVLFTLSAPTAVPLSLSHMQLVTFAAGDELSLQRSGTAQIYNGPGITELTLLML